jgi:hypothetical protein
VHSYSHSHVRDCVSLKVSVHDLVFCSVSDSFNVPCPWTDSDCCCVCSTDYHSLEKYHLRVAFFFFFFFPFSDCIICTKQCCFAPRFVLMLFCLVCTVLLSFEISPPKFCMHSYFPLYLLHISLLLLIIQAVPRSEFKLWRPLVV